LSSLNDVKQSKEPYSSLPIINHKESLNNNESITSLNDSSSNQSNSNNSPQNTSLPKTTANIYLGYT
jgi:hypothetical protein